MLREHPCQYSSWQELVEDHAEIPYRFALGFPIEYQLNVEPYLLEITKIHLAPKLLKLNITEINEIVTQQCNLADHECCAFMKQEMENFVQNILK